MARQKRKHMQIASHHQQTSPHFFIPDDGVCVKKIFASVCRTNFLRSHKKKLFV
jgi:hypothetical protein